MVVCSRVGDVQQQHQAFVAVLESIPHDIHDNTGQFRLSESFCQFDVRVEGSHGDRRSDSNKFGMSESACTVHVRKRRT